MHRVFSGLAAGLIVLAPLLPAAAEETSFGEAEFLQSCASCHGSAGKGDGYLNSLLKAPAPSLTQLSKKNGGVFPVQELYSVIDGTSVAGTHGERNMPIWGDRYSIQAREEMESFSLRFIEREEEYVRFRILALIEYISTLQGD